MSRYSFSDSTGSNRPSQLSYRPPHLRDSAPSSHSHVSFNGSPRGGTGRGSRGRGGRSSYSGRGPVRTRSRARSPLDNGRRGFSYSNSDAVDDVTEKFDELEVLDDGDVVEAANINAYDDTQVEATGEEIPPPVTSFSDVDFPMELMDNITRCQYVKPTPIQRYAIPVAMAGRDLMACAQTGSGKTAAFCFPIICGVLKLRGGGTRGSARDLSKVALPLALILAPTRELSCQIYEEAKKFSHQTGVKVVVAYGGAPISQQLRNLEKGVDILVATPGRLVDMIERAKVSLEGVKYLALDEADRMLDMGFEPQVRQIVEQMNMPPPGARQTMLYSATFPTEIQRLATDFLTNYIFLTAGRIGSSTDLIVQKVQFVHDADKRNHLMNLLRTNRANGTHGKHALTLIFVETKRGADALEHWLSMKGFPSIAIHGGKVQMERERALKSFKNGLTPTLVATDVASRGLDIPRVAHVINFDLPKDIDDYVHRIGRTGRAGKSGLATAFFSDKNLPLAKALVELMVEANQEVPSWLNQYAETSYNIGRGAGGRGNRNGNRKFGGHDYRTSASSGTENCNYSSQYCDEDNSANTLSMSSDFHSTPLPFDYSAAVTTSGATAHPYGYSYNYGTVAATGWD